MRDYLSTETVGALALLGAVVAALIWANVAPHSYTSVWGTEFSLRIGSWSLHATLREWVNQGLMTFFFLVVGLEAKRELDLGELRERRRLALPVVAAIGGASGAIIVYLAINAGGPGAHGWGTAMSTDTAFALGILALIARRGERLRVFLLSLAVVDDLIALIVLGVAYTTNISVTALVVAVVLYATIVLLRFAPFPARQPVAVVLAVGLWIAMFKSGIDPVVSGLAVGLALSAYEPGRENLERVTELSRSFREQPTPELARRAQQSVASAISPNERLQYDLHPWTSYLIVPVFALANAGIVFNSSLISDAFTSPITIGIVAGYVLGKPLGILISSWLATHPRTLSLRLPISWPILSGGAAVAGIGFTVSLLIANRAFSGRELDEAKIGVLASAVLASLIGFGVFRLVRRLPESLRARQIARTESELLDLADDVDPDRDHIRGPEEAPVTLLEYGDFECPYCGQAEPIVRELLQSFGADLRYVFRHLPLADVHPSAQMAAEAAEAAGAQGKFWEMHDLLLDHQDELNPPALRRYADDLGLDADRFWEDVRSREFAPHIAEDVRTADESGVAGTPTFFINGRRHQGAYDVDTLNTAVRRAHNQARIRAAA